MLPSNNPKFNVNLNYILKTVYKHRKEVYSRGSYGRGIFCSNCFFNSPCLSYVSFTRTMFKGSLGGLHNPPNREVPGPVEVPPEEEITNQEFVQWFMTNIYNQERHSREQKVREIQERLHRELQRNKQLKDNESRCSTDQSESSKDSDSDGEEEKLKNDIQDLEDDLYKDIDLEELNNRVASSLLDIEEEPEDSSGSSDDIGLDLPSKDYNPSRDKGKEPSQDPGEGSTFPKGGSYRPSSGISIENPQVVIIIGIFITVIGIGILVKKYWDQHHPDSSTGDETVAKESEKITTGVKVSGVESSEEIVNKMLVYTEDMIFYFSIFTDSLFQYFV